MKCVYHLPRDVVLPNVISVGERAPPKVRLSGDSSSEKDKLVPQKTVSGQNNQIGNKRVSVCLNLSVHGTARAIAVTSAMHMEREMEARGIS